MKFIKFTTKIIAVSLCLILSKNCSAASYSLRFTLENDGTYSMVSTQKSGKSERLLNFDLFFLEKPYSDIIVKNPLQVFELTYNTLGKLKRSTNILNKLDEELNQCSWGERCVKIYNCYNIQQKKLLTLLKQIFLQNNFNI